MGNQEFEAHMAKRVEDFGKGNNMICWPVDGSGGVGGVTPTQYMDQLAGTLRSAILAVVTHLRYVLTDLLPSSHGV